MPMNRCYALSSLRWRQGVFNNSLKQTPLQGQVVQIFFWNWNSLKKRLRLPVKFKCTLNILIWKWNTHGIRFVIPIFLFKLFTPPPKDNWAKQRHILTHPSRCTHPTFRSKRWFVFRRAFRFWRRRPAAKSGCSPRQLAAFLPSEMR